MAGLIARKLASLIATLLAVAVGSFILLDLIPGDPAINMLGTEARPDTIAAARRLLGLDRTPLERLGVWLAGIPFGEFGISYRYRVPVAELLGQALAVTVPLGLYAAAITVALAGPLAIVAVLHHRRWPDIAITSSAQLGLATPNFWIAILLVLVFSVRLGWVEAGGFPGWQAGVMPALRALTLPALALGLPQAAILLRLLRAALLETAREDYVRTARAKGLSQVTILVRHVLRNALVPSATVLGLQFAVLLAGSIIVENVFALPGLGRLVFQAIQQNDLVVVRNVVLAIAAMVLVVNVTVDLACAALDPRTRVQ